MDKKTLFSSAIIGNIEPQEYGVKNKIYNNATILIGCIYGDERMLFIAGISSKIDKLDYNQNIICSNCGKYGRYEVFVEYTCFSLFFIPILKWGKKYYVKTSCCGSIYLINKDIGKKIARNENINLAEQDLQLVQQGHVYSIKRCTNCGFETNEDFKYCPNCSAMFK